MKRTVGLATSRSRRSTVSLKPLCFFPPVRVSVGAHSCVCVYKCDGLTLEHVCAAVEMKGSTGCHV